MRCVRRRSARPPRRTGASRSGVAAGVFEAFRREGLPAYGALRGIDRTWLALDGAMGKAPLGGAMAG